MDILDWDPRVLVRRSCVDVDRWLRGFVLVAAIAAAGGGGTRGRAWMIGGDRGRRADGRLGGSTGGPDVHPRDLFVVFLRMAGLLLIGGVLTHAVNLIGMRAPAELSYYGIIPMMLVVGVWFLLGAPALVARLRWPEASAAAPTEPAPPPATWVAVGSGAWRGCSC
jgi:hypothetical protein